MTITTRPLGAALALALAASPATTARADGSAFIGGLVGGMLGSAISNTHHHNQQQQRQQVRQPQQQQTVTRRSPTISPYQREENRRVQTALNYFGFPAGVADGVLGRNSRAAIAQYQAFMGYPPSGQLSDYERIFLTTSYDRAIVGGPQVQQYLVQGGQGPRGLLVAFRQEQMGVPPAPAAPPMQAAPAWDYAAQSPAAPVAPAPREPEPAPAPVEAAAPAPDPAAPDTAPAAAPGRLPSFIAGPAGVSMASHCTRVSLSTSSNGGFVTVADLDDPMLALAEQFCLARNYAVEQGESLAVTVQGFTMAEMQAQCEAFAPTMWEYQARLVSQPPVQSAAALQDFVVGTGVPPAQLSANARICLGIGYRTDNAELAVAASMVLVGLGEGAYGELLGHHLMQGFGTPKRPERGVEWLQVASAALAAGAAPVVTAGAVERPQLLQAALRTLAGEETAPILQDAAAAQSGLGFALPLPAAEGD